MIFGDRREAGRLLAAELTDLATEDPVVLALPRGGVPVAYEVAKALDAPLDVALARKIGAPDQPELGVGAIGEDGEMILDHETVQAVGAAREEIEAIATRERSELERRREAYRGGRNAIDVAGRVVILVDDGIATGVTAAVVARLLRRRGADRVIAAVPVCPVGTGEKLAEEFDRIVCLDSPARFMGVGGSYEDFTQTTDREVIELLGR